MPVSDADRRGRVRVTARFSDGTSAVAHFYVVPPFSTQVLIRSIIMPGHINRSIVAPGGVDMSVITPGVINRSVAIQGGAARTAHGAYGVAAA